ncbi:peptidoglycan bridge formation protein FemAB [Paramagnetospirillum marisnigri]|uniref:Peptidoglycan bridge formation protein FemAB n=1 Tax=Paramagnetospirillum marisnigri TaxID=1285242 RepID=A0A178MLR8_9PROT|nr:FemAB family XrtA/PEP-CTERM system-associated protein [Paramagnetospirillum marisnigri]OAN49599.1 peptidoglycan bridge formation protein FemAB [Paramagnetospirillum marisnigri]
MAVQIKTLDDRGRQAWDHFVVKDCPDATFFHRSGWKAVIEAVYRQKGHYLYAERNGRIVGVLPLVHVRSPLFGNRLISTAFTIGGGVAALDDEAHAALDGEALRLMKSLGADSLELRRPPRPHDGDGWWAKTDIYANFSRTMAASDEDCLKQIPRKQRAVVRKAVDARLLADGLDNDPGRFFPLYAYSMRNMGTPVFGQRFFAALMKEFAGSCDCLTVTYQGMAIASVLNFYFRDAVMPYYTGCLPIARDLGANDFMYWRLMRHAHERGFTVFDFGRSKVDSGPFNFKKNWGFEPHPIRHEFMMKNGGEPTEINPLNPKFRLFIAAWKRLPLSVANLLGPQVVRHIG